MVVSQEPAFHHADVSTAEHQWRQTLASESRPLIDLGLVEHLVVVAAHPGDETLMSGGLIATAHGRGMSVDVVVATDGERSHPNSPTRRPAELGALRRAEVASALSSLAPTATLHTLGFADGNLTAHHEQLACALVDLIGASGSRTLLVSTWRGDGHTDHEAAARAGASAAWRTDAHFLEAPIWWWHWGSPTDPMPTGPRLQLPDSVLCAKRAAMRSHRSQTEELSTLAGDEAILSPEILSHFERDVEVFFDGRAAEESPFEELHAEHPDPWRVHTSFYEARKRALTMSALPHPTYRRVLELGCSVGALTAELAARGEEVLALDESRSALHRAAETLTHLPNVSLANVQVPEGLGIIEADLVIISEVGYFLSPARLRDLANRLRTSGCVTILACHWRHDIRGWPLDGASVHAILAEGLGVDAAVSLSDPDFVLDVFVLE